MNRGTRGAVVGGLWLGLWLSGASAQIGVIPRETLRGLPGVSVLVERMDPDAERDGVTQSHLQANVERRLRKAGIPVLTNQEQYATPGAPYLYVNVSTLKSTELAGLYAYAIQVSLAQTVILERDPSTITTATTWNVGSVGMVGGARLRGIRDSLGDHVDHFINDFLAVNPQEAPRGEPRRRETPSREPSRMDPIVQAQRRLQAAGLYRGPMDGQLGTQTQEALRLYQEVHGLPVTGELDEATQTALGLK